MKKFLFIFVLLITTAGNLQAANWQLIDKNSEREVFFDRATLQKTISGYRFTWLYNYYEQNSGGTRKRGYYKYQSFSFEHEINCKSGEARQFSASPFAKAMGVEMIYKKETTQTWSMISETQSGLKSAYEILCK